MSRRKTTCEGCGCNCKNCSDSVGGSLHLHVEIENLKQRLLERENHIVSMETNFLREAEKFPNGEMAAMTEELLTWQDKYSRLYESHKRVQKVNQNLEDKLLKIVDKCETEKSILTAEVAALTRRLVDEKFNVSKLQEENERYRNDVNLAIQLLQCKPSNFVPQKYDSLPSDLQQKVRSYVTSKRRISVSDIQQKQPEMKTIKVPIPTFPPTAMVYSVNKTTTDKDGSTGNGNSGNGDEKNSRQGGTVDIVSAAIMAKVLEERERERSQMKHCETCTCPSNAANNDNGGNNKRNHKETQTSSSLLVINNESDVKETGSSFNNVCSSPMSVRHNNNNNNLFNNNSNVIRNFVGSGPNLNSSSNFVSGMLDRNNKLKDNNNKSQIDYFGDDFNTPSSASVAIGIIPSLVDTVDSSNYNRPNNCKDDKPLSSSDIEINIGDITSSSSNSSSNSNSNTNLLLADTDCKNSSRHNSDENCLSLFDGNMHSDATDNLIIFDNKSPTNCTSLTVTTASTSIISPSVTTSLANNFNVNNCTNLGKPIGGTIRHCSVRLQAGTSNILLDNVVDGPYAPVLYKSRQQSTDPLLVHGSSSHRSVSNSCCNDDQRLLLLSNDTTNVIPPSNSMSPSLPSYNLSSNSSNSSLSSSSTVSSSNLSTNSSLSPFNLQHQQRKNFNLAQIRTETEI